MEEDLKDLTGQTEMEEFLSEPTPKVTDADRMEAATRQIDETGEELELHDYKPPGGDKPETDKSLEQHYNDESAEEGIPIPILLLNEFGDILQPNEQMQDILSKIDNAPSEHELQRTYQDLRVWALRIKKVKQGKHVATNKAAMIQSYDSFMKSNKLRNLLNLSLEVRSAKKHEQPVLGQRSPKPKPKPKPKGTADNEAVQFMAEFEFRKANIVMRLNFFEHIRDNFITAFDTIRRDRKYIKIFKKHRQLIQGVLQANQLLERSQDIVLDGGEMAQETSRGDEMYKKQRAFRQLVEGIYKKIQVNKDGTNIRTIIRDSIVALRDAQLEQAPYAPKQKRQVTFDLQDERDEKMAEVDRVPSPKTKKPKPQARGAYKYSLQGNKIIGLSLRKNPRHEGSFSDTLASFVWRNDKTVKALVTGGKTAEEYIKRVFYPLWWNEFKRVDVNPADMIRKPWAAPTKDELKKQKESGSWKHNKYKYVSDMWAQGKLAYRALASNKQLKNKYKAEIKKQGKNITQDRAIRELFRILQDQKSDYTTWAQKHAQEPIVIRKGETRVGDHLFAMFTPQALYRFANPKSNIATSYGAVNTWFETAANDFEKYADPRKMTQVQILKDILYDSKWDRKDNFSKELLLSFVQMNSPGLALSLEDLTRIFGEDAVDNAKHRMIKIFEAPGGPLEQLLNKRAIRYLLIQTSKLAITQSEFDRQPEYIKNTIRRFRIRKKVVVKQEKISKEHVAAIRKTKEEQFDKRRQKHQAVVNDLKKKLVKTAIQKKQVEEAMAKMLQDGVDATDQSIQGMAVAKNRYNDFQLEKAPELHQLQTLMKMELDEHEKAVESRGQFEEVLESGADVRVLTSSTKKELFTETKKNRKQIQEIQGIILTGGKLTPAQRNELESRKMHDERLVAVIAPNLPEPSIPALRNIAEADELRMPGIQAVQLFFDDATPDPSTPAASPAQSPVPSRSPSPSPSPAAVPIPRVQPQPHDEVKIDEESEDYKQALINLRDHEKYNEQIFEHFEYDPHQKQFKVKQAKRERARIFTMPEINVAPNVYQLGGINSIEEVYISPSFHQIEPYIRTDTYDRVREFNRKALRRGGIVGRANSYISIGPWIQLRFLKQTIHMIMKGGNPPQKAFEILARHLKEQINGAKNPRLLQYTRITKKKKYIRTIAKPERLKQMTYSELVLLVETALKRRNKHIIYRQSTVGGPFFKHAAKNDSLY